MRTIIYVVSMSPLAEGHIAYAKALCQYRVQDVGRSGLDLSTDLGCGSRLLMKLDVHLDAHERNDEEALWQQTKDSLF